MEKALLVIDMQNICVGENHAPIFNYDNVALIENVNEIISQYNVENVYYILNVMKKNIINKFAPFEAYEGSNEVEFVNTLKIVNNRKFIKYKGDAFSNNDLNQALNESKITEIEIVGVDGGGCVPLTALGALKNGYKVTINTKAVGTTFIKNSKKLNRKLKAKGAVFT